VRLREWKEGLCKRRVEDGDFVQRVDEEKSIEGSLLLLRVLDREGTPVEYGADGRLAGWSGKEDDARLCSRRRGRLGRMGEDGWVLLFRSWFS
jgi:hypothetical protein